MKVQLIITALLIFFIVNLQAQIHNNSEIPTSINDFGNAPDNSAILDVQAVDKGVLIPRMDMVARDAIVAPATGLIIYQIDNTAGFYYFDGLVWQIIKSSASANEITIVDSDGDTKIQVEESGDEDLIRFDIEGTEYFVMDGARLEVKNSGASVFIGNGTGFFDALDDNSNVYIGDSTGYKSVNGYYNVGLGGRSLFNNFSGHDNVAIGRLAAYQNTTGRFNTGIGRLALYSNKTGHNNTALGYSTNSAMLNKDNSTGLGYNAECTADDQVRIGNNQVLSIGGYVNWTNVSDARFKSNIEEDVVGLDFIKKLKPVTYNLQLSEIDDFFAENHNETDVLNYESDTDKSAIRYSGFIAQEVETAATESSYNFSGIDAPKNEGDFYGLRYSEFVVPLVKAIQEQQAIIENQAERINNLEAQNAEIAELKKMINELKLSLEK